MSYKLDNMDLNNNVLMQIIEINNYCKMIYGYEINQLDFKNGDITDLREDNIIFKENDKLTNLNILIDYSNDIVCS
jgi:hypothetical protein